MEIDKDSENKLPKCQKYNTDVIFWTRIIYITAIVIWLIIIIYTGFYKLKAAFVLIIPLVIFGIGIFSISSLTAEVEDYMFTANFLTVGLLLALPLLNWTSKNYSGSKQTFTLIIVLAITLSILSMYDIWVTKKWLSVYKHARSCLQTLSLTLVIFGLIEYFLCRETIIFDE